MDRAVETGRAAPRSRLWRLALCAIGLAAAALTPAHAIPALSGKIGEPAPAAAHDANPALWEVRDGDTTIYLFGTFHTLDARTAWFDRTVRAAFERSGELVLETIAPTDPAEIRAAGRATTIPGRSNDFLSATRRVVTGGRANGLSVAHGADSVLRRAAADHGKALSGIELFAEQLQTFARISSLPRPALPVSEAPRAPVTLATLLSAWKAGDTRAFAVMLAGFEARSPQAYRLLIADRNARYGAWIEERLDQPGTVFVAVGSGHLAGKDSVQNWLSAKGIAARRIS